MVFFFNHLWKQKGQNRVLFVNVETKRRLQPVGVVDRGQRKDNRLRVVRIHLLCQHGKKRVEQEEEHLNIMMGAVMIHSPVYGMFMQC